MSDVLSLAHRSERTHGSIGSTRSTCDDDRVVRWIVKLTTVGGVWLARTGLCRAHAGPVAASLY